MYKALAETAVPAQQEHRNWQFIKVIKTHLYIRHLSNGGEGICKTHHLPFHETEQLFVFLWNLDWKSHRLIDGRD